MTPQETMLAKALHEQNSPGTPFYAQGEVYAHNLIRVASLGAATALDVPVEKAREILIQRCRRDARLPA